MAETQMRLMTCEEFYQWQLDQDERYELVDGAPRLRRVPPGATNYQDTIVVNCIGELGARLRGKPCWVASANTALRTSIRTSRRPDVTVDCAPPDGKSYEAHKPTVAVEVLSPSTSKTDRFIKLEEYRRHPTIRHILLVDPDAIAAVHYSRPEGGERADAELRGAEAVIEFTAIEVALPLGALYDRLTMTG